MKQLRYAILMYSSFLAIKETKISSIARFFRTYKTSRLHWLAPECSVVCMWYVTSLAMVEVNVVTLCQKLCLWLFQGQEIYSI